MPDDDAVTVGESSAERPPPGPFAVLPEPVRLEDTVTGQDVSAAPDPYAGRDTETEFMLRHM
nr:heme biosynthesis protein HemY [uncultured Actinotalea sp.]